MLAEGLGHRRADVAATLRHQVCETQLHYRHEELNQSRRAAALVRYDLTHPGESHHQYPFPRRDGLAHLIAELPSGRSWAPSMSERSLLILPMILGRTLAPTETSAHAAASTRAMSSSDELLEAILGTEAGPARTGRHPELLDVLDVYELLRRRADRHPRG